ncbi:ATP-binding protein [Streptomyces sp. NRRL S-350]|uniref:ATP-binding protein n=1 Tax=Streptomyces sp. NRRL S-350 TaxID=1463902 RepID=UPI00068BAE88|nr:ATP-binding protein [Streptomyces sp. NRRL S-350]
MDTDTHPAPARRHRQLPFAEDAMPVSEGLAFIRRALADWHLVAEQAGQDAQLVAAELLTNAVRHGGGALALDVVQRRTRLRISVTDPGPATDLPLPEGHRPGQIGGYGLVIIDRLALRWGVFPEGPGKTVWADLLLAPEGPV